MINDGLIYEPLLQFDIAAPPKYYPWLATSYQWSNGGKTVSFTIRQGVKFSNGTPLTPADVAFTYNLVKNNKSAWPGGHPGGMKCSRRPAGRGRRLDTGALRVRNKSGAGPAGPGIVAASTNPRFG